MNRALPIILLILIFLIVALPSMLARSCRPPAVERPPAVDRTPIESPAGEITLNVFNHHTNQSDDISLEEYLVGVVAAEMPASFELEALKAQAIVARTYTVTQMRSYGGKGCDKHPGSPDICTDHTHCQAWESEEKSLGKWDAAEAPENLNKIRQAVRETAGQVIHHNGLTIDAVFHAHCGGHTENSEDVWSAALPYLRAVDCPYCAGTRWSKTEHSFTGSEFAQAMLPYVSAVPVSASGRPLIDAPVRTATGRIKTLTIAGESIGGRDIRAALRLPSTNFTWQIDGDTITFTNRGYGHGVGLCQYGADGMAKAGKTYEEIIHHFYTGVNLIPLSP
ncbi:MAG: stage II sporulation protein D [Bacillota bacterium]|nr:stage II sporulation protein D [Bacillota bacterium]MDW7684393.1 stage II sporulation protein D [Bacillota bacterium]